MREEEIHIRLVEPFRSFLEDTELVALECRGAIGDVVHGHDAIGCYNRVTELKTVGAGTEINSSWKRSLDGTAWMKIRAATELAVRRLHEFHQLGPGCHIIDVVANVILEMIPSQISN